MYNISLYPKDEFYMKNNTDFFLIKSSFAFDSYLESYIHTGKKIHFYMSNVKFI